MESIIWLVAHYPDHPEMDERIRRAVALHKSLNLPIWVFASSTTMYPKRVELMILEKLVQEKVDPSAVVLSEHFGIADSLDTVQEMDNILDMASAKGVEKVYAVSNALQLAQIRGLSRHRKLEFEWVRTDLVDRRWWYVSTRLALIPLAYLGVGRSFPPLRLVRYARSRWIGWNI